MPREFWEADRLADRSMEKFCQDAGANGAGATRAIDPQADGQAQSICPQADGQADVCECPACVIAAFPCLADPPPLDHGRYIGLDRDAARMAQAPRDGSCEARMAQAPRDGSCEARMAQAPSARGPVQDETQSCDPLDALAMAQVEGRAGPNDDVEANAGDRR